MALVTTHCQGAARGATRTMEDPGGGLCISSLWLSCEIQKFGKMCVLLA